MSGNRKIQHEALSSQLDRTHQFFPRADNKVSALFAILSAQIAIAALNMIPADLKVWWIAIPLAAFAFLSAWVLFNLYRCSYPNLEGGNSSLLYFKEIAKLREAEYVEKLTGLKEAEYIEDLAAQIWRNSEILNKKFDALRRANIGTMWSLLPWSAYLLAVSVNASRAPLI